MSWDRTLDRNKWRYVSLGIGFLLFVGPFAFLTQAVLLSIGNTGTADLHTFCFRMPLDWVFGGRYVALVGSVAAYFILGVVMVALFMGPVFCGWLCPVGAVSEGISRVTPLPKKYRIRIKDPKATSGLRYGFFIGFMAVAAIAGYKLATNVSSICCRYCSSSVLQNISSAIFGNPAAVDYWHTGSIIVLGGWLVLGGVLFVGGRGWCLFFCPLGTTSSLSHRVGARLGLYRTEYRKENCKNCKVCEVECPMQAIGQDKEVSRSLCIQCKECVNGCPHKSYVYRRGKHGEN